MKLSLAKRNEIFKEVFSSKNIRKIKKRINKEHPPFIVFYEKEEENG